jgi:uncharacterized C2H2 Zn-finger protein
MNKVCIPNIKNNYEKCECGKTFDRKHNLIAHEKVCPFNNAYVREYFLNGGKIISRPKNFVCPNCNFVFLKNQDLEKHINRNKIKKTRTVIYVKNLVIYFVKYVAKHLQTKRI